MPARRLILLFLLLAISSVATCQSHNLHIAAVENGLSARVHVKGQPFPKWTLQERMNFYHVPAVSIAVVNDGRVEWAKFYGKPDSAEQGNTQTLFQAASISKVATALTVLRLSESHKLDLNEDVNQLLHTWKLPNSSGKPVTALELLSHSAAINFPAGESALSLDGPQPTLLQRLKGEAPAKNKPVVVDGIPGSGFHYSNGGYLVLGQLLEDVAGKSFPEIAKEQVFVPLKMERSSFEAFTPGHPPVNIATGHDNKGSEIDGKWRMIGAPEGGLWSTPSDLAQIIVMIEKAYSGHSKFLQQATAQQMLTKQNAQWGLGVQVQGQGDALAFRHDGSTPGYKAVFFGYANRGQGVVIMTNGERGGELFEELLRSVAEAYQWPDFRVSERQVLFVDPASLKQYVGLYEMTPGANVTVSFDDGKLYAQVRGREKAELLPEKTDGFFMLEGPTVVFEKDSSGKITGLVFDGNFRAKRLP
jgi:CubicO group peptidase (beta-lactamase class C family)